MENNVPIERLQPPGLADSRPAGFSQVTIPSAGDLVFVSGQVGWDHEQQRLPSGLEGQTRQTLRNVQLAVEAAGSTMDNLVKLTIFVVDFEPAMREAILAARNEFISAAALPASTLVGVSALANEAYLVEVEAIALVADG